VHCRPRLVRDGSFRVYPYGVVVVVRIGGADTEHVGRTWGSACAGAEESRGWSTGTCPCRRPPSIQRPRTPGPWLVDAAVSPHRRRSPRHLCGDPACRAGGNPFPTGSARRRKNRKGTRTRGTMIIDTPVFSSAFRSVPFHARISVVKRGGVVETVGLARRAIVSETHRTTAQADVCCAVVVAQDGAEQETELPDTTCEDRRVRTEACGLRVRISLPLPWWQLVPGPGPALHVATSRRQTPCQTATGVQLRAKIHPF
jgi:hypothetical protein